MGSASTLQPVLEAAPAWMLRPGKWLLEAVHLSTDSDLEIALAVLISLFFWSTGARLFWSVLGRLLGFYHFAHFGLFLWTPWRPFFRLYVSLRTWWNRVRHRGQPSARFAGFLEMASMVAGRGAFPFGRLHFAHIPLFQMVGFRPKAHIMIIGGTGGGKTVAVTAALATHKGSSIVIDPSAQVTNVLHAACGRGGPGIFGKGQPSYCLDPDGYVRRPGFISSRWNIFDEWDRAVEHTGRRELPRKLAAALGEALVVTHKAERSPHFPNTAKSMAAGLALFIYDEYPAGDPRRSLVQFRKLLMDGLDEPDRPDDTTPREWLMARMMEKTESYGGMISGSAAQALESSGDSSGDVLSTLMTETRWMDFDELQKISLSSDFSFLDFKQGRAHLSICAAVTDLQDKYAGWFRLLIMTAFEVFEKIVLGDLKHPCLMVIDEFPNLGYFKVLDKAPAHVRKFGIRLVLIAQDVGGMREVYPNAEGMIGNAAATIWLATDNEHNIADIMKKLGQHEVRQRVDGGPWVWQNKPRYELRDRPVMSGPEIKAFLDDGNVIVTRRRRPLLLKPPVYYRDLPVWAYDPDPDYEEPAGRALLRDLCRQLIPGPAKPPAAKPQPPPKPQSRPAASPQAQQQRQSAPPRPRRQPSPAMHDGMTLELARSLYGLSGGPFSHADVLARDEDVMAAGHGNAEYEQKIFQARALLMQNAQSRGYTP